ARDDGDVVVSSNEFLRESEPAFFDRTAHHWRHRQKCAERDGDFHCACKIASSELAARLISKRRRKQFRAFTRIRFCSSGDVCSQRSINRVVPARSSGSTKPAWSAAISRQIFTRSEINTGTRKESASITDIPKFS